jgi:hypothetical protein
MSTSGKTTCPERVRLSERASNEMRRWRKSLSRKERAKLETRVSPWASNGGSIVAPKRRRTKAARKHEKLRRQREARFRAERAAYEARRALRWKIEGAHP